MAGVSAILARSVARIFFRNAINVGLPVLVCETDGIDDGDELEVDLGRGIILDRTKGIELSFAKIPDVMLTILNEGGLVPYIQKYGDFKL
jgi:3-isopropylmalate/(R)-2-methylmalate dehydratase small subunit